MKHFRCLPALGLLLLAATAQAALPPQARNSRDLSMMVDFVHEHPLVMGQLKSVDLEHAVVHWGDDCKAYFVRRNVPHMPGWVGPRPPLEFDRATCPVDE